MGQKTNQNKNDHQSVTSRRIGAFLCMALFLGLILVPIGEAADDGNGSTSEEDLIPEIPPLRMERVQGLEYMGGGDFIGLINEDRDAMIGVIYGTDENPNGISMVSMFTRYLGCADVYDEDQDLLHSDRGIPVRTIMAQSFENIFEYEDLDGDDLIDLRSGLGISSRYDSAYKRVSLRTAWEISDVERRDGSDEIPSSKTWEFSLSAFDLPYLQLLSDERTRFNGTLDEVTLTFHFTTQRIDTRVERVPVFNVTVDVDDGDEVDILDVEKIGMRPYRGTSMNSSLKYDHYIYGWDYETDNDDPHLLMTTKLLMGNYISNALADWISEHFITEDIGGDGTLSYEVEEEGVRRWRAQDLDESDDDASLMMTKERPRPVNRNQLQFDDNWQRIGRISWVSDVQVDGDDERMYFQVFGGRRGPIERDHVTFRGMQIVGGFNYPGGNEIFHDPQFECETISLDVTSASDSDYEELEEDEGGGFTGKLVFAMIAVGVIIFLILVLLVKGRSPYDRGNMVGRRRHRGAEVMWEDEDEYYEHFLVDQDRPKGKD